MRKVEGFTLVELAIVMIIVGLLIGGVLKGQELVTNAEINATVAQVKSIDAATTMFRDKYDQMPGDIPNPVDRLFNCIGQCISGGNGDGRLAGWPLQAMEASETNSFFPHLAAADLLTGVKMEEDYSGWGGAFPAAKIRGGFHVGYHPGGPLGVSPASPPGHYLALVLVPYLDPASTTLSGMEALRIDRKMDDALPNSGSVVASHPACAYTETDARTSCDLAIRFQN